MEPAGALQVSLGLLGAGSRLGEAGVDLPEVERGQDLAGRTASPSSTAIRSITPPILKPSAASSAGATVPVAAMGRASTVSMISAARTSAG
jgi:hypothetical protein